MRLLPLLLILLLAFAFSLPAASATDAGVCTRGKTPCDAHDYACVTKGAARVACASEDEPAYVLCVDVSGRTVACVVDPCGTTSCFVAATTNACDPTKGCSVSKYGYCVEGNDPCPGYFLACATLAGKPVACVPDPCADANCFNAALP